MIEPHLSELNLNEKCEPEPELTPMQELNLALKESGFGKFQIRLLLATFTRNTAGFLVSSTTPYLLSEAECDLNMNLVQKGLLNSIAFLGMTLSIVFAGFLTDVFGRRLFIVTGLWLLSITMVVSGCSQTYEMLVTSKFLEGAFYGSCHSAGVTLTAELCYKEIRDRMMIVQSGSAAVATVVIALFSWALLIQDWRYSLFNGAIVLNTWNFYLIIMSLFGLVGAVQYFLLPESPKFLLSRGKYDEVRAILINIYKENTGKPADTYKYADIYKDKQKKEGSADAKEQPVAESFRLENLKPMIQRPTVLYILMFCVMDFLVMSVYNVVRMWFPQVSTIVEHYGENSADLCVMLDSYTDDLKNRVLNYTASDVCIPIKSSTVTYVNAIIIGCVGVLPYFLTTLIVNKVGKKALIMAGGTVGIATTISLRWANSRAAVVSLFSLDAAATQTMMSMTVATSVNFFPTNIRSFATSVVMMMGRLGTLVGNISFPILLKIGCVVPFFTMSGLLACVVLLSILLPREK